MTRKCRHCGAELPPKAKAEHWQRAGFCDVDCMAAHGLEKARQAQERKNARAARERRQKGRERRRELRERKEALKSRAQWLKEAQAAFNAYIRARDRGLPCISCGRLHEVEQQAVGGTWDCGHYRSVGANPELRFEPLNAHRQCKQCNRDMSGNAVNYRLGLIERLGEAKVAWLEGPHPARKYTIDDLKAIKARYRALTRELKRGEEA